jgi:hypothetical protein
MSHLTVAASAKAVEQMFSLVRDNLNVSKSDNGSWGPFSWSYDIAFHLQSGTLQLNNDGTIEIKHLDVVWDQLKFQVCFNLPGFCVGGFCIIPDPFDGCWVSAPQICIGGPICLPLDLSGLVSQIDDLKANLVTKYWVDPTRPPNVSDLTAEFLGKSNQWQVFVNPTFVDVLPIDAPATIENIIENVFKQAIQNVFSWVPGWAWSLIWALLGPLLDLLKSILGIAEDIQNWVEDLLNNIFNLVAVIETAVAQLFASQNPLFQFEDPYSILDGEPSHNPIPVKIPIRNLAAQINAQEMVVTADIGP